MPKISLTARPRPVYSKDSMDRLGDDLTELILSYLWFSDKVRLECMCKQWRKLIYQKQFELDINGRGRETSSTLNALITRVSIGMGEVVVIDKTALKSVLKKCPYIKSVCVQIPTDGAELEVISCYCPYLKALEIDPTDLNQNILYYFGTKCGHLLEKVKFDGFSYSSLDIREFLKLCPNLKAIDVEPDSLFIREEKHFLPELEDIERIHIRHKNSDLFRKFEILTDKYGNSMKNVKLIMYNYSILQSYQITGDQLKTVVAYLSLFKNLRSLELTLFDGNDENITEPIDDSLAMIGQNCTKLTKLKLVIAGRHIISNNFFNALSQFSNVEKLFLELNVMKNLEGSPQCLKLRRLKYLHIECDGLNKVFLSSFETAVPTLQYANIRVQNRHKVWKKFTN